ncbi:MAG: PaaI family thioesterase, partial [Thermodesulfobacteriota bacterium]|nr:PaaI family thioesterase [Thermodesulfobacteriota bacterium]
MPDFPEYLERLQSGDWSMNPFLHFMGMVLEKLGDGYARFRMPVREEFLQGAGVVQGGLIVAMASETIAHAVMTLLKAGEGIATIELKNNFLATAKEGDLIAEGKVFKKGGTVIIGDALVSSASGKPLSRTSSS